MFTPWSRILAVATAFAMVAGGVYAEDVPTAADAPEVIVIDALAIKLPQDKLLAMMPELVDDGKIAKAVVELLDGVKRKEYILRGCPMLVTKNGNRAISETSQAVRFLLPRDTARHHYIGLDPERFIPVNASPVSWVGSTMGVTLEAEPVTYQIPGWLDMQFTLSDVDVPARPGVALQKVNPPVMSIVKDSAIITLHSGQYMLVGVHPVCEPEGYIEIFIIRATERAVE